MPVNSETRRLLLRWKALAQPDALQRVKAMVRALWIAGLFVVVVVAIAIARELSPVLIACAAAVAGWLIAETNALRNRIAQWDIFRSYLDWGRIERDLGSEPDA